MKIMCLIKVTCPLKNGIAPIPLASTLRSTWGDTFFKYSDPYIYNKFDFEVNFHLQILTQRKTNYNVVLLFDSEEELNVWANNCRLTDSQLIADQKMWETAHGITFTYEYYSLSPTTGPEPIV